MARIYLIPYSSKNYWRNLRTENFKYHRKNLETLIDKSSVSVKRELSKNIFDKAIELSANPTQINPYSLMLNEVVSDLNQRRFCEVTGLDISMQKESSKMLSISGLRYYQKNESSTFRKLVDRFLTDRWGKDKLTIQIQEIAHNIRNAKNNRIISTKRKYPVQQLNLINRLNLIETYANPIR